MWGRSVAEAAVKRMVIFVAGGLSYGLLEIIWRGYTHISMFLVGGLCLVIIGSMDEGGEAPCLLWQACLGSLTITVMEFTSGVIVNLVMGLDVWNYSSLPFNIMGQICLPYSVLWLMLSIPAIYYEDILRHFLFGESIPHQRLLPEFIVSENSPKKAK
ncbi:MAG: putative ABC transporter permease [Oscillospiraceae bacterium]|nr:putative ABC transporter permease [Oscillospiraceae bacterium]